MNNHYASDTLDSLSYKLDENVSLEFQVLSLEKENEHLKLIYQRLFDSIKQTQAQTKLKTDSLQEKLKYKISENVMLRAQLQDKFSKQKDELRGTSANTKFAKPSILGKPPLQYLKNQSVVRQPTAFKFERPKFSKSQFIPKVVEKFDLTKLVTSHTQSRVDNFVPNKHVKEKVRTKPITVSQPRVITKKDVNSNTSGLSSKGLESTTGSRIPQPRSNTKNDRVISASKSSCLKNNEEKVEEHHRNLLFSNNQKHMSSECNNIKLAIRNDKSEVICVACKKCLITDNHDVCNIYYVNGMNYHDKNQSANVSNNANQTKHMANVKKSKKVGYQNLFTVRRLGLFQAYDRESEAAHQLHLEVYGNYLEVAFKRNTCFVRNLEGVDLLKGNRSTNLYTINLHEMTSTSPICLMAHATSTKSWLWHQRLSRLNFDTINNRAKDNLVTGLPKFKYSEDHLYPSCEQRKSKKSPHKLKPVPNSKNRLHLLHMNLYRPMRVESINGKRYVLVIVDDYSRYTWVHFLRSKDKAPEVTKIFLKQIQVLLQAPVRTPQQNENDHEDIGKLGAKGDIGFFIGYSNTFCAYRVYNRRTKKVMKTMNFTFDELSVMAFEQHNSKPELQGMTYRHISSGLNLTYAPSTIISQKLIERDLELLFEAMYDSYIGGQPSDATKTAPATTTTLNAKTLSTPTNSSSHALTITNTS
ncbi:retrovirus-related pol polyprotein from transposon TNT 1-94 [Tanacetum coccineum]